MNILVVILVLCSIYSSFGAPSKKCELKDEKQIVGDLELESTDVLNPLMLPPRSCKEVYEAGKTKSGIYSIRPDPASSAIQVYCDMSLPGGGWTVILKRKEVKGDVEQINFQRKWNEYVRGFGDFSKEFFLGLETIRLLTEEGDMELFIGLQSHDHPFYPLTLCDVNKYARYDTFKVDTQRSNYQLLVDGYNEKSTAGDSLLSHNMMPFSTFDKDNDPHKVKHCAKTYGGGWWYHDCHDSQLTGKWREGGKDGDKTDGIVWESWTGDNYSLKTVIMAIRQK